VDLDGFPRIGIGRWPTPVTPLERVSELLASEVWAKREDECGAWGGNKVRKLEHVLHEARSKDARKLVTFGAGSSSWAAALALHGAAHGFEVTLGLGGPVPHSYRALYREAETEVVSLPRINLVPAAAAAARARAGRGALILPGGGSGGIGDVGSARAGAEVADAIVEGELPRPIKVFVALGTCGTAAGLAAGLGLKDTSIPVTAVKVAPWPYATERLVRKRTNALVQRLQPSGIAAPVIHEAGFYAGGYGIPGAAGLEAIDIARRDGLDLDPTYAAKAFAALVAEARARPGGPFLFLHTSPGPLPQ
jgi:D-cysteine desulfhydrase